MALHRRLGVALASAIVGMLGLAAAAAPAIAQAASPGAGDAVVHVVAAENFYGDVAQQIGGATVAVTDILSNPDEDPHLFEASPSVARAISAAQIVIYNGADYDPWVTQLLGAARSRNRREIEAAALMHRRPGDNPHLWYDPATMPKVAAAIAAALSAADPKDQAADMARLQSFVASLAPVKAKIAAMRRRYHGVAVTATEPVFGYMATALGLAMRNARFQLAVMNNTEPAASDVAAFDADLRGHRVKVLLYNRQASDSAAQRLVRLARASHIPVVGVTETEPAGETYQAWMLGQLDALAAALAAKPS